MSPFNSGVLRKTTGGFCPPFLITFLATLEGAPRDDLCDEVCTHTFCYWRLGGS